MRYSTALSKFVSALFTIVLFAGCSSSSILQHPTTNSTLWMQNAAEYHALTTSIYQNAANYLELAKNDSYWTAYPSQEDDQQLHTLAPAIVLDVDETVLNNAAYQARMIRQKSGYDPQKWNQWVMEAQADAVPGALAFTKEAAKRGITIFYLTNREAKVEEGTRKNLQKLGFPLPKKGDHILSKNEGDGWTSAKVKRRAFLSNNYRILMFFGDNLNDFVPAKDITMAERSQLVQNHQKKWGRKWFMLPNPVYGSWENALYDFDENLSPSQVDSARKNRLNTKSQ